MKTTEPGVPSEGTSASMSASTATYKDLAATRIRFPGYDTKVGPLGHLAAERERLSSLEWEHFEVAPMAPTIGAEVIGIDIATCDDPTVIASLRDALVNFKVLVFRDQEIDGRQHVEFARRFGDLEIHPFLEGNPELPELVHFEKSADVGGYENGWHNDVTWRAEPSLGAVLRAIKVPLTGGDTLFADSEGAYRGLDDDFRNFVDGLTATHDFAQAFGFGLDDAALAELRKRYPIAEHPVIRTHPESNRRGIFVNRFFTSGIRGLSDEEGRSVIDRLCDEMGVPEYHCRLRWRPGTVAFWDNRSCQHLACSDYWPDVRIMERASIVGDRPF